MNSFDKQNLVDIRNDLCAALAEVSAKHNIVLNVGLIAFTDTSFSAKLTADIIDQSTGAEPTMNSQEQKWRQSFKTTWFANLKKDDLGAQVTIGSKSYTIAGARPRAKLPIVLKKTDGGFVAMSEATIAKALGR